MAYKRVTSYLGFDPNAGLQAGHDAMIAFFSTCQKRSHGASTPVRVIYAPFEMAAPEAVAPCSMSLVLTSPPFYDLEAYGRGATGPGQSFDTWASTFLQAFVDLSVTALRPGGFFAVHINDSPGAPSVRALHHCVAKWPGLKERAPIAILGPKGQARPVWVWQKTA
jgi:hypothetical protein